MAGNDVRIVVTADGKQATSEMGKVEGAAKKLGGAFGDMAKIAGGFVLGSGIMNAPGFLMSAAKAAAEDAAAQERLNQAVKNTGYAWEDYANVFDEVIAAGQKKAFTDDDIRNSLVQLLAATGDVTEAEKRHALALDFARGAGISLEQASKLLGKVTDENVEVFKRMGITIGEGATEAEAFAVIQAKFAGQADVYAKSTAGQFEQAKIRMGELKEQIGAALLPVMTNLMGFVLDKAIPAFESLAEKIGPVVGHVVDLAAKGRELAEGALAAVIPKVQEFSAAAKDLADNALSALIPKLQDLLQRIKDLDFERLKADLGDVKAKIDPLIAVLRPLVEDLLRAWKQTIDDVTESMRPLLEELAKWEPILKPLGVLIGSVIVVVLAAMLLQLRLIAEIIKVEVVVAVAALTAALEAIRVTVGFVVDLFNTLNEKFGVVEKTIWIVREAVYAIRDAFFAVRDAVWAVIGAIDTLISKIASIPSMPDVTPGFDVPGVPHLASGGIVTKPTLALIGESGPEAVVPLGHNTGTTINVTVMGSVLTESDLLEVIQRQLNRAMA